MWDSHGFNFMDILSLKIKNSRVYIEELNLAF